MLTASELRKIRKHMGFSIKSFASILDLKLGTYKKIETGNREVPSDIEERIEVAFPTVVSDAKLVGSVDYLRVRFRTQDYKTIIDKVLKLSGKPFVLQENGRYAYSHYLMFGHINLYFSEDRAEMGTLVEFSGQGCAQFEWYLVNEQERDWKEFFLDCVEFSRKHTQSEKELRSFLKFTRIDIALDEYYSESGNYNIYDLKLKHDKGLVHKKAQNFECVDGFKRNDSKGKSLYFGSRESLVILNFYEKDLEQADKLNIPVDVVWSLYGYKNRYEVRLQDKVSDEFVWDWIESYQFEVADKAVEIINDKIQVYDENHKLDKEWYSLMGSYGSFKFEMRPEEFDIGVREYRWYDDQVSRTVHYLMAIEVIKEKQRFSDMTLDSELSDKQKENLEFLIEKEGYDGTLEDVEREIRRRLDWK